MTWSPKVPCSAEAAESLLEVDTLRDEKCPKGSMQVVVSLSEVTSVPKGSQLHLQGCLCLPTSALGWGTPGWPLLCPFHLVFRRQLPEQSEGPVSLPGGIHTSDDCAFQMSEHQGTDGYLL